MFCIATHDSNSNCTFELLLPNLQSSSFPVGVSSLTATAINKGAASMAVCTGKLLAISITMRMLH